MTTTGLSYHAPATLEEAIAVLAQHGRDAALLGGGTDIVPGLKYGVFAPRHLVSLKLLGGLRGITVTREGGLDIGALVTLRELARSAELRSRAGALADATNRSGSPLLRARGTLGGNLCLDTRCWYYNQTTRWRASRAACLKAGGDQCHVNAREKRCVALFAADTPPPLIALGAEVSLAGPKGTRRVPLETLYAGDGLHPIAREPAEILTTVHVPAPRPGAASAYEKWSERESVDFPIVGAAVHVALAGDGSLARVRIALTGVSTAPVRLGPVEALLAGKPLPPENHAALVEATGKALGLLHLAEAVPHKRRIAGVLVSAALARAASAAREARQ